MGYGVLTHGTAPAFTTNCGFRSNFVTLEDLRGALVPPIRDNEEPKLGFRHWSGWKQWMPSKVASGVLPSFSKRMRTLFPQQGHKKRHFNR